MVRVLLSVLQFRVNARYVDANPPFIGIEMDHSDSGREGCAVSTLTITSEPKDWRGAVTVAVQEVRRLQRYGVTRGELERYKTALLRDSEQLAEQAHSVPSVDNLEFVMESLALGHTVLDQREAHAALLELADSITGEEVDALGRSLLSFASHYRGEAALMREFEEAEPGAWAEPGPTRATAIVACVPAFMDASGHSTGGAAPMARGASLATTQHVDPAAAPVSALDSGSEDEEVPEGAVRFELEAGAIEEALAEAGLEVEAQEEVEVSAGGRAGACQCWVHGAALPETSTALPACRPAWLLGDPCSGSLLVPNRPPSAPPSFNPPGAGRAAAGGGGGGADRGAGAPVCAAGGRGRRGAGDAAARRGVRRHAAPPLQRHPPQLPHH